MNNYFKTDTDRKRYENADDLKFKDLKLAPKDVLLELISSRITYGTLAKHLRLAIKEFKENTNADIEGYSFEDLISWLEEYKDISIKEETL